MCEHTVLKCHWTCGIQYLVTIVLYKLRYVEKRVLPQTPPLQKLFRCLSLSSLLLICMLARTAGWWLLCVIHPCSALLVKLMNHQSPGIKEPEGLQCLSPFPLFTAPSVTPSRGVGHVNAHHWWQEYSLKIFQGIGIMAAMVKVIRDDVAWSM